MKAIRGVKGVRGLMALLVIMGHFTLAFLPQIGMGEETIGKEHIKNIISDTPLYFFFNGAFAVGVFWMLSAALTFYNCHNNLFSFRQVILEMLKRYIRWAFPMLLSVTYICISMKFGVVYNQEVAKITGSGWLGSFYQFPVSMSEALRQIMFDIYIDGNVSYNMVLWTMRIEFWGSLLVLIICWLDHFRPILAVVATATIILASIITNKYIWVYFMSGVILGYMMYNKDGFRIKPLFQIGGVILVLFAGGYPSGYLPIKGIYAPLAITREAIYCLGAISLLMVLFCNNSIFSEMVDVLFGIIERMSLSVYMIQLPILCTIICWIYYKYKINNVAIILVGIIITFIIAFVYNCILERFWEPAYNRMVSWMKKILKI